MLSVRIPSLKDRLQAFIIDGIIIVIAMFVFTYFLGQMQEVSDELRMYLFIFLFFIYDPLLTYFGGTLGHRASGLRVRYGSDTSKNISLPAAFIRFGVKFLLGWISLLSVSVNSRGKAIHDFLVGSVVVYKDDMEEVAGSDENLPKRKPTDDRILDDL